MRDLKSRILQYCFRHILTSLLNSFVDIVVPFGYTRRGNKVFERTSFIMMNYLVTMVVLMIGVFVTIDQILPLKLKSMNALGFGKKKISYCIDI